MDYRERRAHKGQLEVELFIPHNSTLTGTDIDRILKIASWDGDVTELVKEFKGDYEGNRAVLIPRDQPYTCHGLEMRALQVSGVGYRTTNSSSWTFEPDAQDRFKPPTVENFMEKIPPNVLRNDEVKDGRIVVERSAYAPTGSYTETRMKRKVEATNLANSLDLKFSCVPRIEAWGSYDSLQHEGANLGFVVLSAPAVDKPRFAQDVMRTVGYLTDKGAVKTYTDVLTLYVVTVGAWLPRVAIGLRELHNKGYAHGQPHSSNFYAFTDKKGDAGVLLADWSTVRKDNDVPNENLLARSIDLLVLMNQYDKLHRVMLPQADHLHDALDVGSDRILAAILFAYGGNDPDFFSFYKQEKWANDHDQIIRWLKRMQARHYPQAGELDADAFADGLIAVNKLLKDDLSKIRIPGTASKADEARIRSYLVPQPRLESSGKTGRNDPCPCGSGSKFKKCHGP